MTHPVLGRERYLLDPEARADRDALEDLLHADFAEVGASGTLWDRDSIIRELMARREVRGEATEMVIDELAYGVALLTYRLGRTRRASVWVREGGRWQLRYHQGTPLTAMSETR